MNDPIPPEGNAFNPDTFQYFDEEKLPKDYGVYIAIDPAFSESPTADFGVIMVALHDGADNIYVHGYYRQRTNSRKLIDEFERIYRIYAGRVRAVGIEEVGPQKSFYQQLVSEMNTKGLYPPFQKLTGMIQTQSGLKHKKEQRIIFSLQPRFEARKIYVRPEQQDLIEELTLFSEAGNKHDDLADSLSYIVSMIHPFQNYETDNPGSEHYQDDSNRGVTGYYDSYAKEENQALRYSSY